MKFETIYTNARDAVERALRSLWASQPGNQSQDATSRAIREAIKTIFASDESMPIVQCTNSYESVLNDDGPKAEELVYPLWGKISPQGDKHFFPFKHQYECWKTLLEDKIEGKPMSICVTTGTGSGKTECFMIPLIKDLLDQSAEKRETSVKAIFLYPLNALMEDQKERLENLLEGTDLTYTVYNADLPEKAPKPTDHSKDADAIRQKIDDVRGIVIDSITKKPKLGEDGKPIYRFKNMVYTRDEVRKNPPDIILTNPTMLEYILLRKKDESLINPSQKSLRWIAVDETHTYTGAGAAELSMLLRRVMMAFNVDSRDIRFATSSATFANDEDPSAKKKNEHKLQRFIAGLTGLDDCQVRIIDGKRNGKIPDGIDHDRWKLIYERDFVALDTLFPEGSVEDKLHALDEMCSRLGNSLDMKIKVHYFFRVPNNGLYVKLTEYKDGAFKIYTRNEINDKNVDDAPMLELSRCRTCGEYSAIAKVDEKTGEYCAPVADDSDMFDIEEESTDSDKKTAIIGLTNTVSDKIEYLQPYYIHPSSKRHLVKGILPNGSWQLVANVNYCCPYCGNKQTHNMVADDNEANTDSNDMKMMRFRVSADFISRIIAPVLLDEVSEFHPESGNTETILHQGQQYLSFADSRQMAAKATLNQNLQQERMWFYTTIYHELCSRKGSKRSTVLKQIAELENEKEEAIEYEDLEEKKRLETEIEILKRSISDTISWREIAELFKKDKYCPVFCEQFLKKDAENGELDKHREIPESVMDNYIHSMMVMYLAGRPSSAAAPETMGLFHPEYPKLKRVKTTDEVTRFNESIDNPNLRISDEDWRHLLRYVVDYSVRTNQAVYLKLSNDNPINIKSTNRFMAEKPRRRPAHKPTMEKGKPSDSRVVRFLAALYGEDKGINDNNTAQEAAFDIIKPVIDSLWETLTEGKWAILTHGSTWDSDTQSHVLDKDKDGSGARRLNLTEMSFKLYDEAWLTDVNNEKNERHTVALRPVDYSFKGFAPYLKGTQPVKLDDKLHQEWEPYPYYQGCGTEVTNELIEDWAKIHRSLLWDNGIWGDEGVFADRLRQIHLTPNLFIQGEHTAQVDKSIARRRQQSFKNHGVNILACSTTMEMGVDLGSLELVMLSSVPPQPANYKQRAGRSGRNNRVKSACVTLCTSDAIGMRTYFNALDAIINRPVEVPMIDLKSPQVVERHINSFLIKYFGVFGDGNINQKVVNYYTHYEIVNKDGKINVFNPLTNNTMEANDGLGDSAKTNYARFNAYCDKHDDPELEAMMRRLLRDTVFESTPLAEILEHAKKMNERCYAELCSRAQDLAYAFNHANGKQKYLGYLNLKYVEMLNERLLTYWATNRFTPNANMPVNVLELDLNASQKNKIFKVSTSTNPSYSLREAIAQYVPGNSIAVDGVVYVVRGLICSNMFERVKTFQKIYMDSDRVEIVSGDCTLHDPKIWSVNGDYALELVRPVGFLPDVNESTSRILDNNAFTQVRAQLIGANDWDTEVTSDHLFTMRDNRESGDSKILYYNEGLGYGFAYCTRCGRTTIERQAAINTEHPEIPPFEMNPIVGADPEKPAYHKALSGKQWPNICSSRYDYSSIRRNVIIGDVIQTDYCEIKIRHKTINGWINERSKEQNLLVTLGIVLSQALAEILGKERQSVDFALTPNGHICIFDTNPGGSGYSNQLKDVSLMVKVIDKAYDILSVAKQKNSKDILLDKYTLRYLRYIDVDAVMDWIEEERSFSK